MYKRIFVSGLAGAIVLLLWTFVVNVLFGFGARFNMKQVPNEREVYAMLRNTITEPGRYICNPALTSEGRFPDNQPVFGIHYSGVGHEAAGLGEALELLEFLSIPLIGAWMLSRTSEQYRSRFFNRVGYFIAIGLLIAITRDFHSYGIGGSPPIVASLAAASTIVTWTIVGVAVALLMRPLNKLVSAKGATT